MNEEEVRGRGIKAPAPLVLDEPTHTYRGPSWGHAKDSTEDTAAHGKNLSACAGQGEGHIGKASKPWFVNVWKVLSFDASLLTLK